MYISEVGVSTEFVNKLVLACHACLPLPFREFTEVVGSSTMVFSQSV